MKDKISINEQIRAPELRVVGADGRNLGVISTANALAQARAANLDLILVSPGANPPVGKIMDYGQYQYQLQKKAKQARSNAQSTETKSIQVKIGTGDHDLLIKAGKVSEFLRQGHRVKIDLFLRGRAKYFDEKFLRERLDRLLKFVSEDFKIAVPSAKSHKGLTIIIERQTGKSATKSDKTKNHANQKSLQPTPASHQAGQGPAPAPGAEPLQGQEKP